MAAPPSAPDGGGPSAPSPAGKGTVEAGVRCTPRAARSRKLGAALGAAILAVSACSSGGSDGVASAGGEANAANQQETESTEELDPDAQALAFAGCARDNGVDMPDPGPGQQGLVDAFQAVAGNYDSETLEQAISVCEALLPQYAQEQHSDDVMLELAECLREQGLDVSDDPFSDIHGGEIDQSQLSAAMEVCRDVLTDGGQ